MNKFPTRASCLEMYNRAKPYLGVILLQFGYAGMPIIAKSAINQGMNIYTYTVYRNAIAALIFAPFAVFLERKVRPGMTASVFWKILLLGLLEPVLDQNLYYTGMKYTSATFTSAMCNILPAITFVMAWILRLEKVNIKRLRSQGKVLGTLVTVGGAMIMTLVIGPTIRLPWSEHDQSTAAADATDPHQDSIKGALMITAGCLCWACFVILQAITLKSYPAELSLTALICTMGTIQGIILTIVVEKENTAIWAIHWDTKFQAAVYGGIVCAGAGYYISGVIMRQRGPVFVTAFGPLSMVIVAILGPFMLSEQLVLGRVIGAVVIVIGLYLVLWGKSKDQCSSESDSELLPVDQAKANTNLDAKILVHDHVSSKVAATCEAV
ncbi:putative Nodulin MtN21 /EamA-like transporter family protein [Heracleum sosnowskyi]|uniref:WAT1-related protein n=1 Tax=Heracleum sosnowskyi TaxID=360622 RepID=A0AAD8I3T0_9APIA|nr:putative Nodulin MtN21 /EamA-like transporter family protein [Heracleum sosnowskyi]